MPMVLGYAVEIVLAQPPHEREIKTREDGLSKLVPELSSVLWQLTRIAIDATKLEANAAALDCAAGQGRELRGVSARAGEGLGDRDADARRLGAAGSQAQEAPSNKHWKSLADGNARIAKMKDKRTHLAHKTEHAVDLDTGAVLAVTLQGADRGDTTTLDETLCEAAKPGWRWRSRSGRDAELRPDEEPKVTVADIEQTVTDKDYHSGAVVKRMKTYGVRSYIPEKKQKGRRNWAGKRAEQQAVYANWRRARGQYGKSLLRRRGELVERSFAHCYETGGMRRCHLRGRVQSEPDPAQIAGRGHPARAEKPAFCGGSACSVRVSTREHAETVLLKPLHKFPPHQLGPVALSLP